MGRLAEIREIPLKSLEAVKQRQRDVWLGLFAEDAVVEDPVGPSTLDPEGKGCRGKEEIAKFYDMFSAAQKSYDYIVHHIVPRGDEVATDATFLIETTDGTHMEVRSINVYRISPDNRILSLRAFWNAEDGPDI